VPINAREYRAFQDFLQHACGIYLGDGKEYLVASRLNNLLTEKGIESVSRLLECLHSPGQDQLKVRVIDAMTTNETYWFRDTGHFTMIKETILPDLINKRGNSIRIWSAACSSGQEPYSISMVIEDYLGNNRMGSLRPVEILATDVSSKVIEEARNACYCGMSIERGLTPELKRRYFIPKQDCMEVHPEVRKRIQFRVLNLTKNFDSLGRFDIIFCRNVLIYFSNELKRDILNRLTSALNPGGYLLLGSTESISQYTDRLQMHISGGSIIYRLKD
jgi:chemotaxis protein methyltransferase CheR